MRDNTQLVQTPYELSPLELECERINIPGVSIRHPGGYVEQYQFDNGGSLTIHSFGIRNRKVRKGEYFGILHFPIDEGEESYSNYKSLVMAIAEVTGNVVPDSPEDYAQTLSSDEGLDLGENLYLMANRGDIFHFPICPSYPFRLGRKLRSWVKEGLLRNPAFLVDEIVYNDRRIKELDEPHTQVRRFKRYRGRIDIAMDSVRRLLKVLPSQKGFSLVYHGDLDDVRDKFTQILNGFDPYELSALGAMRVEIGELASTLAELGDQIPSVDDLRRLLPK
jgi:hypothetical protein